MTQPSAGAITDALQMMDIVNNSPEDVPAENVRRFTLFLNAMIELGQKLRGEPTKATFVKVEDGEIEYLGLVPLPDGGVDTGFFEVSVTLRSTLPGETGVRKKPPRARLLVNHIFESVVTLDPRRFRRCRVCNNVFYARRLDAECCSHQHATQYRTAEFRARRKENYHYKKLRGE